MKRLLTLTLPLILTAAASAQNPIGPFIGTESDSFETQTAGQFTPCIVGRVFNNNADLCTPGNSGAHITGGWGFFCTIPPHSGTRFTGSAGGYYEYTFDSPVSRFGGYFGTNNGTDDGVANFFDPSNNFLGSAVITAPADCTWTWNGWEDTSGNGFARIEIRSNAFGGAFMMMDSMEADFGPSGGPGTVYCVCDGSGTPAPCGNTAGPNEGCRNSSGSGAALVASGSNVAANNNLAFACSGLVPTNPVLLYVGINQVNGGLGSAFGDGLRCAGGAIQRLGVRTADAGGNASWGPAFPITWSAGDVRNFQAWGRDVGGPCGGGFNLSNGVQVIFQ